MGEEMKIKQMLSSDVPFGTIHTSVRETDDGQTARVRLGVADKP
jgi:hypothetical protein